MQLDSNTIEKIDAISILLQKPQLTVINEALDLYLHTQRENQLEAEMEAHKKETNLSYDEFWDDTDF